MKTILYLLLILFILSCSNSDIDNNTMDHSNMDHSNMDHSNMDHSNFETALHNMSVEIIVSKDAVSGVNIELITNDFRFSPKNVNTKDIDGEGHAHLYIDDQKWGRVYSNFIHVGNISDGKHIFKITLNTNSHNEYTHHNSPIQDEIKFEY